jgi:hypothetical protein
MSINRFVVTGLRGSLPRTLVYRNDGQEDNVDLPVFLGFAAKVAGLR